MRRRDLWFVIGVLAAATLWMDFSHLQRHQNGDSVIMCLVSLYQWTPMLWEQDRLGMLVPALALPFRTPLANLLAQSGITIFAGLACFYLLGYYAGGRRRGMTIGSLGGLLFLLLQREWRRFNFFVYIHQFTTSLSLSLVALIALEHWQRRGGAWRLLVALVGLWLALWVNPSVAFAVGPLILFGRLLRGDAAADFDRQDGYDQLQLRRARRFFALRASDWLGLAFTISGLAASMAASQFIATTHQPYAILGPSAWLDCAIGVARDLPGQLDPRWFWAVIATAGSGAFTLFWVDGRRALPVSAGVSLALVASAAVQFAFITSLDHVHRTNFGHYAFGAVMLWQAACLSFCVLQWAAVASTESRAARAIPWGLLTLFFIVAAARHGRPGVDVVRAALADGIGKYSTAVLDARASHVIGSYTDVWTTVFHANLLLVERGSREQVWGISTRAAPTADRWTATPLAETHIAEIVGEEAEAEAALARYGVPPLEMEREAGIIRLKRPVAPLSASSVAPRKPADAVVLR